MSVQTSVFQRKHHLLSKIKVNALQPFLKKQPRQLHELQMITFRFIYILHSIPALLKIGLYSLQWIAIVKWQS